MVLLGDGTGALAPAPGSLDGGHRAEIITANWGGGDVTVRSSR
jgi:hypothetical protein